MLSLGIRDSGIDLRGSASDAVLYGSDNAAGAYGNTS